MGFELQPDPRLRVLGVVMLLAGVAITVQFYRTLAEASPLYILAYVPPAALSRSAASSPSVGSRSNFSAAWLPDPGTRAQV